MDTTPAGALMRLSGDLLPMMLPVGYTFVGEKNHRYRETSTILFVFLHLNSFPPSATSPLPLSRDDPEPILIGSQRTAAARGRFSKGHGYTCITDDLCFAKGSALIGSDLI
jgi:hypothetical protein